ncbi:MAG: RNA polymerase factor sigma-54 [Rickettsiales bacterium]
MRLEQRVAAAQTLAMTARMQQSIHMLQMNAFELEELIDEEIASNPFLERAEKSAPSHSSFSGTIYRTEGIDPAELAEQPIDLASVIMPQICAAFTKGPEREAAFYLAGNLDERGYLAVDLAEAAETLGHKISDCERVLERLQRLEPSGIFARDLCECLLIQLREQGLDDAAHLEALERMKARAGMAASASNKHISPESLSQALLDLRALNPFPGDVNTERAPKTLVPDCIVELSEEGAASVRLNDEAFPGVVVRTEYCAEVGAAVKEEGDVDFVKEKRAAAVWLKSAIERRCETLLKTAAAVATFQQDYFRYGTRCLKPMTLADVAHAVGMHESTVSRATNGKHIAFRDAVIPLKFFFSAEIGTGFANAAVKSRLAEIVKGEPAGKPFSDQKIADMLCREGMEIARRTVLKYREELGIGPSSRRRKK